MNRCKTCPFWDILGGHNVGWGACTEPGHSKKTFYTGQDGYLITKDSFGCVLHPDNKVIACEMNELPASFKGAVAKAFERRNNS